MHKKCIQTQYDPQFLRIFPFCESRILTVAKAQKTLPVSKQFKISSEKADTCTQKTCYFNGEFMLIEKENPKFSIQVTET
jgi:hypothetical protein